MRANRPWTFRVSASSSGVSTTHVGQRAELAEQVRVGVDAGGRGCTRSSPWTRIRSVPSGTLIILWTSATVPTS